MLAERISSRASGRGWSRHPPRDEPGAVCDELGRRGAAPSRSLFGVLSHLKVSLEVTGAEER